MNLSLLLPENMPGVDDVRFVEREPAEKRSLLSWEQVKQFYTFKGIKI